MTQADKWYESDNMATETAHPCEFKIGDTVQYTNDQGVVFAPRKIIGYCKPESEFNGRFIYINSDSPWFPVRPESLVKINN